MTFADTGPNAETQRPKKHNADGTPLGETGLSTKPQGMPETETPGLTPEQADRGRERLKHLLPSLRSCPESRTEVERILPYLEAPAHPAWLMARVLALLSPYFEKDSPLSVREIEANDWAEALKEKPEWAVENACRWWKSSKNENRRKRPIEGDIEERVAVEMAEIRAARIVLDLPPTAPETEAEPREVIGDQRRQEIMRELDYTPGSASEIASGMRADASGWMQP